MNISIVRFAYTPMGTFGRLLMPGFECFTLEEVWNDNKPNISCIPVGVYGIKRGVFPRHKETFEVMDVPDRSAILFHTGNTISDISGCIVLGRDLGWVDSKWAIKGGTSAPAYRQFMNVLTGELRAVLTISNYHGGVLD